VRYECASSHARSGGRARRPRNRSGYGLPAAVLAGLPDDILLIPLPGHTPGHSGVAVRTADGWLPHAGDAYFYHGEIEAGPPVAPPELELLQQSAQADAELRVAALGRLRALHREHGDEVRIVSAHDPWEFARQ
jgi:glyoxylase-like metal-dependent hydrolase (beta-lactamase superfamily II)